MVKYFPVCLCQEFGCLHVSRAVSTEQYSGKDSGQGLDSAEDAVQKHSLPCSALSTAPIVLTLESTSLSLPQAGPGLQPKFHSLDKQNHLQHPFTPLHPCFALQGLCTCCSQCSAF
jgi:hypothetical protein